jgi:hypothetical protein
MKFDKKKNKSNKKTLQKTKHLFVLTKHTLFFFHFEKKNKNSPEQTTRSFPSGTLLPEVVLASKSTF